ncbi:hypothetical protein EVAR_90927_1 [Eumeta japonica]|uniref:Uncharacterized protein n=2 Tax=Eumeta variegata TaxID=151549 RepID=A0A4C2AF62_EUMVA|nr:hypothetical protein EVAR_90927_1 [Eumeta japonica]
MAGLRSTCLGLLRTHSHCACDPAKPDVLHVSRTVICSFGSVRGTRSEIGVVVSRRHFPIRMTIFPLSNHEKIKKTNRVPRPSRNLPNLCRNPPLGVRGESRRPCRAGTRCPFKRGAEAGGRSETGVLAKARQGAAKKLAKPATLTFPLEAGEGSIEMPRQTETPEGASVAPVGGFAKRVSPCQPSPSAFTSTRPPIQSPASRSQEGSAKTGEPTAANRAAVKITALTREARDELEALRNISREVKTSVCEKLQRIAALALSLEESRSHHILEVEREKTKRARDLEAAEKRLQKTTEHHLDRCLRVETAVANMAAEIKRTQDAIDRMDIPNKLEGLRKTLEIKPTTYAAAAAKPKLQAAAKPQVPGPKIAAAHTLIVSSRCANHTSDQVVKAIREVVDAREMGWGG